MNLIKFVRIFLLIAIIVGLGLIATQKIWVPILVDKILESDNGESVNSVDTSTDNHSSVNPQATKNSFKFITYASSGPAAEIYSGTATVSGEYLYEGPNFDGEEWFTFFPDQLSSKQIPGAVNFYIYRKDIFTLFNLPSDTCYAEGTAEIEISGFWLLKAEIGALSESDLVKVIQSTKNVAKTRSVYGADCGGGL